MKFDWQRFVLEQGIAHTRTNAENLGLVCPYCGRGESDNPHMQLKLDEREPWWHCWRCGEGGKSPIRLVCKLLGVSMIRAERIVKEHDQGVPDDFDTLELVAPKFPIQPQQVKVQHALPKGCRPLGAGQASGDRFLDYLAHRRGFGNDATRVARDYALHYAMVGEQAWRVVLPVYEHGQLVAWTGRLIYEGEGSLRYKASGDSEIKKLLPNFDDLDAEPDAHEKILAISEGPMDFLKLDYYGRSCGMRATCTFGTSWTIAQLRRLIAVVKRFAAAFVLFDRHEYMQGVQLAEELSAIARVPVSASHLPVGRKDPGDMTAREVVKWASTHHRRL